MFQIVRKSQSEDPALLDRAQECRSTVWEKPLGYLQLPDRQESWEVSLQVAKKIRSKYSHLSVIGMGGSSLGAKALVEALGNPSNVSFFLDTDPEYICAQLKDLDLANTHWLVVSKSGGTLEVMVLINYISEFLDEKGLDFSEHCTVITEPKESLLAEWAKGKSILCVDHPMDVGGRFSVLSPVGMIPCAFSGINIENIQAGAQWLKSNPKIVEEFSAQTIQSFKREEYISLFWFYSMKLESFGLWLNQLWAESLGKSQSLNGDKAPRVSTPYTCIGARDQHSVLQQIAEGSRDKFVSFFQVKEFKKEFTKIPKNQFSARKFLSSKSIEDVYQAQAQATSEALEKAGVNLLYFEIDQLDEKTLGAMVLFFEATIGVLGEMLQINPYDQPGVEAGKVIAVEKLNS